MKDTPRASAGRLSIVHCVGSMLKISRCQFTRAFQNAGVYWGRDFSGSNTLQYILSKEVYSWGENSDIIIPQYTRAF